MGGRRTFTYTNDAAGAAQEFASKQRNLGEAGLGGVVFGCTNETYQECIQGLVFGLPRCHFVYVQHIRPGMPLFLYNYSDKTMHGIFRAVGYGDLDINPVGWTGGHGKTRYPAQVQVGVEGMAVKLTEGKWKPVLTENFYSGSHFAFELTHAQASKLCGLCKQAGGGQTGREQPLSQGGRLSLVFPQQPGGSSSSSSSSSNASRAASQAPPLSAAAESWPALGGSGGSSSSSVSSAALQQSSKAQQQPPKQLQQKTQPQQQQQQQGPKKHDQKAAPQKEEPQRKAVQTLPKEELVALQRMRELQKTNEEEEAVRKKEEEASRKKEEELEALQRMRELQKAKEEEKLREQQQIAKKKEEEAAEKKKKKDEEEALKKKKEKELEALQKAKEAEKLREQEEAAKKEESERASKQKEEEMQREQERAAVKEQEQQQKESVHVEEVEEDDSEDEQFPPQTTQKQAKEEQDKETAVIGAAGEAQQPSKEAVQAVSVTVDCADLPVPIPTAPRATTSPFIPYATSNATGQRKTKARAPVGVLKPNPKSLLDIADEEDDYEAPYEQQQGCTSAPGEEDAAAMTQALSGLLVKDAAPAPTAQELPSEPPQMPIPSAWLQHHQSQALQVPKGGSTGPSSPDSVPPGFPSPKAAQQAPQQLPSPPQQPLPSSQAPLAAAALQQQHRQKPAFPPGFPAAPKVDPMRAPPGFPAAEAQDEEAPSGASHQQVEAGGQNHVYRDNGAYEPGDGEAAGLRQLLAEAVQGLREVQAPLRLLGEMQAEQKSLKAEVVALRRQVADLTSLLTQQGCPSAASAGGEQ